MKAILLISHGSRSAKTLEEVRATLSQIKTKASADIYHYAFLELESPSILEGIEQCISEGAKEVVVLLNFLNSGRHVNEDIPAIINKAQKKHSAVVIRLTKPVGQHPAIINVFSDLINE